MSSSDACRVISPLAFYRIVPLHSVYMWTALAAVTAVGTVMLVIGASTADQVLVPVVILQMFAASTGFAVPARRGHYDLLLTGGAGRVRVAATHLGLSIAPGLAAWVALTGAEYAVTGSASRALAPGTIAALLIVSTLSWAVTVPLPRLSGGIIWLLAIVMLLATTDRWRAVTLRAADSPPSLGTALLYALCPFVLVGRPLAWADSWVLLPTAVLAVLAPAAALFWMARMDVTLEASQ